ncbi:MAG: hypothetical protein IM600_11455 [Bacteroidetes bacterium]|jgi:hypothetical protein|nr:hypothetical protein [Bacteroidota bacterium]MCA6444037.1 hypothetical protein [Bacteroidota bacterium]
MKIISKMTVLTCSIGLVGLLAVKNKLNAKASKGEQPCVFLSLMGEQSVEGFANSKSLIGVNKAIETGESFLAKSQNKNGGWGAGSHAKQDEMNPLAVSTDPATTAMAAMALYRCGHTIYSGEFKSNLRSALDYLLTEVNKNKNSDYITSIRGTQIQSKLGQNIDAVLTLQFFNQLLPTITENDLKEKVKSAVQICVDKIEKSYDNNGKIVGAGWAGVLQSSFANTSLEMAAKNSDIKVNKEKLEKARAYQKQNYDADKNTAKTDDGAGIMLYAVSSSVRNSAAENNEVNQIMERAKKEGKLDKKAEVSQENLQKAGLSKEEATKYVVANKVYNAAKGKAMQEDVLNGFGNNGGEEFLSFLQTGESMIVSKDNDWKKWYDNIGGKLIKIQNDNGSWNGHHCITSPAFCTATCLLVLSIENDIDALQK